VRRIFNFILAQPFSEGMRKEEYGGIKKALVGSFCDCLNCLFRVVYAGIFYYWIHPLHIVFV
jgi:hypothetical protein